MAGTRRTIELTISFTNERIWKRFLGDYATAIAVSRVASGLDHADLAERALVCKDTVKNHEAAAIRVPNIRTVYSILFACGFETVIIHDGRQRVTRRKSAGRKRVAV